MAYGKAHISCQGGLEEKIQEQEANSSLLVS